MCNPQRIKDLNCFVCLLIALCFFVFGLAIWLFVLTIDFSQFQQNTASPATTLATTALTTLTVPTTQPPATLGFDLQPLQVVDDDDNAEKIRAAATLRAKLLRAKAQQHKKQQQDDDAVSSSETSDSVAFSSSSDSSFEFDVPLDGANDDEQSSSSFLFDVSLEVSSDSDSTADNDYEESSSESSSDAEPSTTAAPTTAKATTKVTPAPTEAFAKREQNILMARATIKTAPKAAAATAVKSPIADKKIPAKPVVAAPPKQAANGNSKNEPAKVLSMAERLRIQKANKA